MVVVEGYNTGVLHGAASELVSEDLLVFVEGEWVPEELLVEFHRLDGDLPEERGHAFQVFDQRANAV